MKIKKNKMRHSKDIIEFKKPSLRHTSSGDTDELTNFLFTKSFLANETFAPNL